MASVGCKPTETKKAAEAALNREGLVEFRSLRRDYFAKITLSEVKTRPKLNFFDTDYA